jgi:hypothetical protein
MTERRFDYIPTPEKCDLCAAPLGTEPDTLMYDARTPNGMWGCVCDECVRNNGMRLGTGFGQRYRREADGRFWYYPPKPRGDQ